MRRLFHALIAIALVLPSGGRAQSVTPSVAGPLAAPATQAAPKSVITLVPWRSRWAAEAVIGGKPRLLLFDTGAGFTHISASVAEAAGCRPWGRLTGFNMMARRVDSARCENIAVEMDGRAYSPPVTGLIEMGDLDPRDTKLDGLMGIDVFDGQAITLDLRAGHIVVESDASLAERTAAMTPVRLRLAREVAGLALAPYVGISTPRGELWFELDSGNGGTVLISKANAELFALDPALQGAQTAEIQIAGGPRVSTDQAYAPDMIIDGNLGMPFLRDWIVTLDLRTGRGWLGRPRG